MRRFRNAVRSLSQRKKTFDKLSSTLQALEELEEAFCALAVSSEGMTALVPTCTVASDLPSPLVAEEVPHQSHGLGLCEQ